MIFFLYFRVNSFSTFGIDTVNGATPVVVTYWVLRPKHIGPVKIHYYIV